jgi:hypothetical protein
MAEEDGTERAVGSPDTRPAPPAGAAPPAGMPGNPLKPPVAAALVAAAVLGGLLQPEWRGFGATEEAPVS